MKFFLIIIIAIQIGCATQPKNFNKSVSDDDLRFMYSKYYVEISDHRRADGYIITPGHLLVDLKLKPNQECQNCTKVAVDLKSCTQTKSFLDNNLFVISLLTVTLFPMKRDISCPINIFVGDGHVRAIDFSIEEQDEQLAGFLMFSVKFMTASKSIRALSEAIYKATKIFEGKIQQQ